MFRLELRALLDGWTALIDRERAQTGQDAEVDSA
jgi:hypothetical protein